MRDLPLCRVSSVRPGDDSRTAGRHCNTSVRRPNVLGRTASVTARSAVSSIHADYRCRHSGRCCTADWDVPVEAAGVPVARRGAASRAGCARRPSRAASSPSSSSPTCPTTPAAMLERNAAGRMRVLRARFRLVRGAPRPGRRRPARHLPPLPAGGRARRRGTFVGLSHYCPTAAALLFRDDVALTIVEAPARVSAGGLRRPVVDRRRPAAAAAAGRDDGSGRLRALGARTWCAGAPAASTPESVLATLVRDAVSVRALAAGRPVHVGPDRRAAAGPCVDATARDARRQPGGFMRGDGGRARRSAPRARRSTASRRPIARFVRPAWSAWSRAAAALHRRQGVRVLDGVSGPRAAIDRARARGRRWRWCGWRPRRQCRDAGRALDRELLLEAFRQADFSLNHLAVGEDLAVEWSKAEA